MAFLMTPPAAHTLPVRRCPRCGRIPRGCSPAPPGSSCWSSACTPSRPSRPRGATHRRAASRHAQPSRSRRSSRASSPSPDAARRGPDGTPCSSRARRRSRWARPHRLSSPSLIHEPCRLAALSTVGRVHAATSSPTTSDAETLSRVARLGFLDLRGRGHRGHTVVAAFLRRLDSRVRRRRRVPALWFSTRWSPPVRAR